jgi:hypothetical protein
LHLAGLTNLAGDDCHEEKHLVTEVLIKPAPQLKVKNKLPAYRSTPMELSQTTLQLADKHFRPIVTIIFLIVNLVFSSLFLC